MARYPKRTGAHAPLYVELPLAQMLALKGLQRARVVARGGQPVHLRELIQEAVDDYLTKERDRLAEIQQTREEAQTPAPPSLADARKTLAEHQRKRRQTHP